MNGRRVVALVAALHVAIARADAAPVPLDQAGADELGRICAQAANQGEKACVALRQQCDEAKKATPGKTPAACRQAAGPAGAVAPKPKPVPNPRAFPEALDVDVAACRQDARCVLLSDFRAGYGNGFRLLSAWCLTRALEHDTGGFDARGRRAAGLVCGAIAGTTDDETKALSGVPASYLFLLQAAANEEQLECSGFALTVPFVRLRYPVKDQSQVSGPVAAGLGGGYYWARKCRRDWSWGLDAFGYSEGIDVTNDRVQFGVAAGVGLVVYEQFRLGFDLGYDLYRQEPDASGAIVRNGLFAYKELGRPSLGYLFTLSFQGKPEAKSGAQP